MNFKSHPKSGDITYPQTSYSLKNIVDGSITKKYLICFLCWFVITNANAQIDPLQSGNEKLSKRNFDGAIQDFNKAVINNPNSAEALCGRAEAKIYLLNYPEAMKDAELAANIDPNCARAHVLMGEVLFVQKDYLKALKSYMDASQLPNPPVQATTGKAKVMNQLGNAKEAYRILDEAIQTQPNAEYYYARGMLNNSKEKYSKAIQDFDKAISLKPAFNMFGLYLNRGATYLTLKEMNKALEDFDKAVELDPKNAPAYHSRGLVHYEQGDYEDAIADFLKATDLNPNNSSAYYNLGMAYYKTNNVESACLYFHKSCPLGNTNACKMIIMICSD
jgi:tetratricopeptide (TPR) repeat protein